MSEPLPSSGLPRPHQRTRRARATSHLRRILRRLQPIRSRRQRQKGRCPARLNQITMQLMQAAQKSSNRSLARRTPSALVKVTSLRHDAGRFRSIHGIAFRPDPLIHRGLSPGCQRFFSAGNPPKASTTSSARAHAPKRRASFCKSPRQGVMSSMWSTTAANDAALFLSSPFILTSRAP